MRPRPASRLPHPTSTHVPDPPRRRAAQPRGRIKNFPPDVVAFVAYLIAHEAHHRGQICSLSRQLGHRLPNAVTFGMWEWNKRRQDVEHLPRSVVVLGAGEYARGASGTQAA